MGKRRRPGNLTPQKTNNSREDLVGNEENEYPVPDLNRTLVTITNELSDTTKKNSQRRNFGQDIETIVGKLQDMVNQKIQDALEKYQDTTNKKLEKTEKHLNELREDFSKLQNSSKEEIQMAKKTHEKMLTTPDRKGNANQNYTKIPSHSC
jgi:coenzyme F420-reducing hydrogenase alpha subunit